MDVIQSKGVKVPNSLLISGLVNSEEDEEVLGFLKQFGPINRIIEVTEQTSEFFGKAIVEYSSGAAVKALDESLPLDKQSDSNCDVVFHIDALASVYSCERGSGLTKTFLSDLQNIAELSGKSFEHVLRDELTRITDFVGRLGQSEESEIPPSAVPEESIERAIEALPTDKSSTHSLKNTSTLDPDPPSSNSDPPATVAVQKQSTSSFMSSPDNLTPPEVQRVVVEHIVKSSEFSSHMHVPSKLRPFSGRVPCPNFEVDYDTWRSSIECHLADPTVSSAQLVRRMVDSLLPPAASVVKSLSSHATPEAFLALLDSAYAVVEDGDELFAQFLSINQNSGEKPSSYLQRLQAIVNRLVKMKTIQPNDSDKQLLKQFCRGCWNNALINTLQLEQRKDKPPTFPEFLLLLRTEEDRQAAKANRMKQHLGLHKPKAQASAQVHDTYLADISEYNLPAAHTTSPLAVQQIQRQIVELQAQIAALSIPKQGKVSTNKPSKKKEKEKQNQKSPNTDPSIRSIPGVTPAAVKQKPKPWYCFQCGEDGHIAVTCDNPPNPTLVSTKREQLKEKQRIWEQNHPPNEPSLN